MEVSRTKKTIINVSTGFLGKIISLAIAFVTKTVFIKQLGAEYNGVNGLYSNILTVLSLADLGITNVLNFFLFQALKEGDKRKIASLVNEFKKIYLMIGFFVLGFGLLLIPFLNFIVKSSLSKDEIVLYYVLFLLNSVCSYFVAYKTTIISADQKNYIVNICSLVTTSLMYILQTVYLVLFRNYVGYLIIQVACTIANNLLLTFIANKSYAYINEKQIIDKRIVDTRKIFDSLKATSLYRVCTVLINNTDNILISIIVGTAFVGYYGNYYMLIQYINVFISIFTAGLLASIGNLNAEKNYEKSYKIFRMINLIYGVIGNICVCCIFCCIQKFVLIWIGMSYLLENKIVVSMLILLYMTTVNSPIVLYRESLGLFNEVKYIMVVTVVINIFLSVLLGRFYGMFGILIATPISKLMTHYWYEPMILFKNFFKKDVKEYYCDQMKNIGCTCLSCIFCCFLTRNFKCSVLELALSVLVCCGVVVLCEIVFWHRTEIFRTLLTRIKNWRNC